MNGPFGTGALTAEDWDWIRQQVAQAPKLTTDQRDRLAELLRPIRVSRSDAA